MIASAIESPLKIYSATVSLSRPNVTRICVDIKVCKSLQGRIWIGVADWGFW